MKLYYDPRTVNCRKVLAGYDLMCVEYETVKLDYFAGDHKKPEFVAINPNAALPALTDGDFMLWESNAMLQYGAGKVGATTAYPEDLVTRVDINRWLLWEASVWFAACYVYLVENVVKPIRGSEPDQAVLDEHAPNFAKLARILDGHLAGRQWMCGADVTIADIAMAAPMHLHKRQKLPLADHPSIRAWIDRVEALTCWQRTDVAPLLGLD